MPRVIFKYVLNPPEQNPETTVQMPGLYQVRAVMVQDGRICLWLDVPIDAPLYPRTFEVIATGEAFGETDRYIGTVQMTPFMWHVIERQEPV